MALSPSLTHIPQADGVGHPQREPCIPTMTLCLLPGKLISAHLNYMNTLMPRSDALSLLTPLKVGITNLTGQETEAETDELISSRSHAVSISAEIQVPGCLILTSLH